MSFAQEGLWLLEQQEPETATYNLSLAFHLAGSLTEQALHDALDAIVARHEILRTTYEAPTGVPVQVIRPPCPVDWATFDLSKPPGGRSNDEVQDRIIQEARRPFDLSSDLMLRARLFRLASDEHILLLVMHHIATDGFSTDLLLHEISVLYNASVNGEEPKLPELALQYADHALRQRELFQGSILERDLAYWKRQLEGVSRLILPTDRARGAEPDHHGASISVTLPRSLVDPLKRLGREENATLFMVFLAALMVMLRRYTGQDDICVGVPIAGRTKADVDNLIGLFVNMLVLREDLSAEPTFRDLLRNVRDTCLDAFEHQELPFERLVSELQPERVRKQIPFFHVTLSLLHGNPCPPRFSKLTSEYVSIPATRSKFDLRVGVRESSRGLMVSMTYATALFDRETIQRALAHYEILLAGVAKNADQPISAIPMFPSEEKHRLLVEWSSPQRACGASEERCVHELFEAQAAKTPERIAVVSGDESLTYRELAERVERLAAQLRCRGIRRHVAVGILLERGPHLLVSILAVLKAGGAYVPFDLTVPRERLIFMLKDADARCLITQRSFDVDLSAWKGERIEVDSTPTTEQRAKEDSPVPDPPLPDDIACILYTSGSTGKPKGVMHTHRGVANHLSGACASLAVRSDDIVLHMSSPAFDMSLRGLIGPLICGACVVLLSESQVRNPAEIISTLQARHVSAILGIVPSLLSDLVDTVSAQGARIPSLRLVASGGETCSGSLAQRMLATFGPRVHLFNCYGPTEVTGISTIHRIADAPTDRTSIPIGRPLPHVNAYVLDRSLEPTGIGIPGELHLAGPAVAKGYVNAPELTAERFIRSPFDSDAVLYKTGDRARWLASGELEFLGHVDRQIKLRGYRIELAEIEIVLWEHPEVRQAVVEVYEPVPGEQRLVAYVVSDAESRSLVASLREHLREYLPRYMFPSQFIVLDRLPLTARGKADRAALPRPSGAQRSLSPPFVAPRTPIERSIAGIWREILHVERIGVRDDFFDMGGHSLLAIRLIVRVEETFGVSLPLSVLFEHPTLESLSQVVEERNPRFSRSTVVCLQKGDGPPFFCVPPAASSVNHFAQMARVLSPNLSFYGMQALGLDEGEEPQDRIEDMAALYIADMRAIQPRGPYFIGGRCFGAHVAYEMALQLVERGEQVALLALLDPTLPPGVRRDVRYYVGRAGYFGRRNQLIHAVGRRIRWTLRQTKRLRVLRYLGARHTRRIQRTYKAHLDASRTYEPGVYSDTITFFAPRAEYSADDSRPLWKNLTTGGFELHLVPGTHRTISRGSHLRTLVQELESVIHEARQQSRAAAQKGKRQP